MSDAPRVQVVLLNWNQKRHTLACIRSLLRSDYPNLGVAVVDNASTDGSAEAIGAAHPQVETVRTERNLGCAGGRNAAFEFFLRSGADFMFSLDNDTVVHPRAVSELVARARSAPGVGVVGPVLYHYRAPTRIHMAGGAWVDWRRGVFYGSHTNEEDCGQVQPHDDLDSVGGGMTFARRAAVEAAGAVDERYFIYYEDSDWCLRVKRAGYRLAVAPQSKVWHNPAQALGGSSPSFYYYRTRNRLLFMGKNAPRAALAAFIPYFVFDLAYNQLYALCRDRQHAQMRAVLLGVWDFARGRFEERRL